MSLLYSIFFYILVFLRKNKNKIILLRVEFFNSKCRRGVRRGKENKAHDWLMVMTYSCYYKDWVLYIFFCIFWLVGLEDNYEGWTTLTNCILPWQWLCFMHNHFRFFKIVLHKFSVGFSCLSPQFVPVSALNIFRTHWKFIIRMPWGVARMCGKIQVRGQKWFPPNAL